MSDQRGLLAPGSQQEPPAGEVAPHAFPQAIAVPAPPAAAPAPASMYSAPMASGGGTDGAAVMTTIPMDPHNPYGPGAVAVAPPPVPQAAVVSPYDPYGQPLPQHHQQQQQHQQHQQQPPMQPPQVPQHVSPMHPTQKQAQFSAAAAPPMTAPQVTTTPPYRDVAFMVAFLLHVAVIFILAFSLGAPALSSSNEDEAALAGNVSLAHPILGLLVVVAIVGGVASSGWVYFLQRHAKSLITCTLYTTIVVEFSLALALFFVSVGAAILFLLLGGLTVYYLFLVRKRIGFASAILVAACDAVRRYSNVFFAAFVALFMQLVWVILWSLAFIGVEANSLDDGYFSEFLMLISFFWGLFVIKNIVHCTTAGAVGSWWFVATPQDPVWGAFRRACTTSFGSICLGSLIVAVLSAIRAMINAARRNRRGRGSILLSCAGCFVGCVERLMEYFNHWAFIEVALYGKDFKTAGKDAMRIFKDRGWTMIINDDLIGRALLIGCVMVACVTSAVGAAWAAGMDDSSGFVFAAAFLAFLVGFGMCAIMSSTINSAVGTVFVCFAEHPDALAATHPNHLQSLVSAWQTFHPQAFAGAGYDVRFARPTGTV